MKGKFWRNQRVLRSLTSPSIFPYKKMLSHFNVGPSVYSRLEFCNFVARTYIFISLCSARLHLHSIHEDIFIRTPKSRPEVGDPGQGTYDLHREKEKL